MGVITYNGVASSAYNIIVSKQPNYEFPEKDVEVIHVPGRNGDLVFDKGIYNNVKRTYSIWAGPEAGDFKTLASKISKWLHSSKGYAVLEDTYEPDYYRMAYYKDENNIENMLNEAGTIDATFICKPQRFYKSGNSFITVPNNGKSFENPTVYTAQPVIKVSPKDDYPIGTFTWNGRLIRVHFGIGQTQNPIYIDATAMDCYSIISGSYVNKNQNVVFVDGYEFPMLESGITSVQYSDPRATTCVVEVKPNWYTI